MTAGSRKKCHIKYLNCLIFDRLHMYILLSHGWEKIGLVVSHCVLVCIIIRLLSLKIGSQFFPHTLQFNIIPNSKQDSLPHPFYWEVCILSSTYFPMYYITEPICSQFIFLSATIAQRTESLWLESPSVLIFRNYPFERQMVHDLRNKHSLGEVILVKKYQNFINIMNLWLHL